MTNRPQQDPLGIIGTIIAEKYRIDGLIGEGGFSVVYRAEHLIWQQPVAIKCFRILSQAPAERRDELLDGFIQEGRLLASLSSRTAAIVQARDIGKFTTPDGLWIPYMVLEWLEGKTLDQVLFEERIAGYKPREVHEALALLEPVASALEIAHSKNIAHRDIKPANIFIIGDPRGPSPFTKVLDFGIAKVMAEHAALATALAQTGKDISAFTPNYGAPEQFSRTHGATGPWTDVFAMALIMVEMLRGAPVLDGDDFVQLAVQCRDPNNRPTPRSFGVEVSPEVEAVFAKALAVAPADRYPSMGRFWAALYQAVFPEGAGWNMPSTTGIASGASLGVASGRGSMPSMGSITAQRAAAGTGMGAPPASGPSYGTPQSTGALAPASMTPASMAPGTTGPGSRGKGGVIAFAAVAALALLGGSFVAYKLFRKPPPPSEPAPAGSILAGPAPTSSVSAAATRPTECPSGMALVPGGKFYMGSDDPAFKLWQPAHQVSLDLFCIDLHEVTAGEYKECSDKGECKRPEASPNWPKTAGTTDAEHEKKRVAYAELCTFGKPGFENHPVNCVNWAMADRYCKWRDKRLPTEAEWEYAARGSDGRKFPWGDDEGAVGHMNAGGKEFTAWERAAGLKPSDQLYPQDDGFPATAPVGSFPKGKTRFGADDFVGNVWEWTADWFETYKPDEVINPKGAPAGDRKAMRGGGFNGGNILWLNPAFRFHQVPDATQPSIGFRCAKDL
ncbi:bifunctional serine/threonine-protein kinase/formylglycine-generating enzyme family protein [Polyangium aurulentum]|uniref:bifunctional serine/threonine-protein kinase/formylglycine-generating enzyme family protein n=1 Tax=Polyangium aurulentum TaxID=2567896 RepID=UPI0010AE1710|nr:bifunctional serine/threonine-protein kinase/formylglycine-generating enzyme family protein [Polyangium aurulentum]UQA59751.1 SUMF1/EgtB/PvdO family nonheme iron enzyme [Polyangium aurulentum]